MNCVGRVQTKWISERKFASTGGRAGVIEAVSVTSAMWANSMPLVMKTKPQGTQINAEMVHPVVS